MARPATTRLKIWATRTGARSLEFKMGVLVCDLMLAVGVLMFAYGVYPQRLDFVKVDFLRSRLFQVCV